MPYKQSSYERVYAAPAFYWPYHGPGYWFAHAFLGVATAKMSNDEATRFRLHSLALDKMGHIGMGLLLISGVYMIIPYGVCLLLYPYS